MGKSSHHFKNISSVDTSIYYATIGQNRDTEQSFESYRK